MYFQYLSVSFFRNRLSLQLLELCRHEMLQTKTIILYFYQSYMHNSTQAHTVQELSNAASKTHGDSQFGNEGQKHEHTIHWKELDA